jgi:hypothetical protein
MEFLVSVHANRHHKQLIFCITLFVLFFETNTKNLFPVGIENVFVVVPL